LEFFCFGGNEMGLDLKLLPFDADFDGLHFSHTVLNVRRDSDLWVCVKQTEQFPVPNDFTSFCCNDQAEYEEWHYGVTTKTSNDKQLTYTAAKNMKGIAFKPGAVAAYINALDDDVKVALYWC
jgi:hypothetical protein